MIPTHDHLRPKKLRDQETTTPAQEKNLHQSPIQTPRNPIFKTHLPVAFNISIILV